MLMRRSMSDLEFFAIDEARLTKMSNTDLPEIPETPLSMAE